MKKPVTTSSIIILLLLFSTNILAQKPDLIFEKVLDNNDKSIRSISNLHQDDDGFIWFSTLKGLCRYDGYELKVFQNVQDDSTSLPFIGIDGHFTDSDGTFWLMYKDPDMDYIKNIYSYDPNIKGHRIQSLELNEMYEPQKILEDSYGNFWISTNGSGLHKYNRHTGEHIVYCKDYNRYSDPALQLIDSIRSSQEGFAEIIDVTDLRNEKKTFSLDRETTVLIISVGEGDGSMDDYGSISAARGTIWKMDYSNTKHAGGILKNRIEISIETLSAGSYVLNYDSDDSHSYGLWNGPAPDVLDIYGIQLFKLEGMIIDQLQSLLQRDPGEHKISSNIIRDIQFDAEGRLWMLTPEGLSGFDESSQKFVLHEIDFEKIIKANDGGEQPGSMLPEKDFFWIITDNNTLLKYDLNDGSFQVYREAVSDRLYPRSLHKNHAASLLLPDSNKGHIFDPKTNAFYSYELDENNIDLDVFKFIQDRSGTYWLPSEEGLQKSRENRFYYLDLLSGYEFRHLKHFHIDGSNTIWYWDQDERIFCSYDIRSGVKRSFTLSGFNIEKKIASSSAYRDWNTFIYEDSRGNFWLAGWNAIYNFDRAQGRITVSAEIKGEDDVANSIIRIFEDSENKFWVFSNSGIYLYNYDSNTLAFQADFNLLVQSSDNVRTNNIDDIVEGSNSSLWIRTYNGLFEYNKVTRTITKHSTFPDKYYGDIHRGNLHMDKENKLWFASYEKLYKYNIVDQELSTFVLREAYRKVEWDPGYSNYNVSEGEDGILWISIGAGLVKFDISSEETRTFSKDQGLVGNKITDYVIDDRGMIWVATHEGISRFDPVKEYFTYYKETFNVDKDTRLEHQFLNTNVLADGSIIFPTTYGMITYHPEVDTTLIPPVVITAFSLFDQEYQCDTVINRKKVLRLNHKQNFFSFRFAALDYARPEINRYMYKLEGLDDEWTNCDANQRSAKYTKVAPGEYVFRVKGANSDGVWNEEGSSLRIIVSPPWYKTILAYIIYGILFFGLLYMFMKIRERKLRRVNELLEKVVAERTEEVQQQKEEIIAQRDNIIVQRNLVTEQKEEMQLIHQEVTDSINYARRLQNSAFPDWEKMDERFRDSFVLFKPKAIVSGDFYWFAKIEEQMIITVADCTGHGVPGAFMSMLGISLLKEIIVNEYITHTGVILNRLRKQVIKSLGQKGTQGEQKDGMDISLCSINVNTLEMQWSGANSYCLIIRNGELIELKGDNMPIAIYERMDKFKSQEFQLRKDDIIYMASDGYVDQFGGPKGKKFMRKRFKNLLLDIAEKSMKEQHMILKKALEDWQNEAGIEYEQVDDITVMGLRIS